MEEPEREWLKAVLIQVKDVAREVGINPDLALKLYLVKYHKNPPHQFTIPTAEVTPPVTLEKLAKWGMKQIKKPWPTHG